MTDCVIRPATPADLPACAAIINAYIDATDWLPRQHSHDAIAAFFSAGILETRQVFVADRGGAIQGYASFNPGTRFLSALYLRPEARGYGIGKALLDAVKAVAPSGFTLTVWQPSHRARQFYQREAFSVTGEGTDENGLPVWHMRWGEAA